MPAVDSAPVPERAVPAAPSIIRRGRILVIDDEPMIGRSLQRKLSPEHDVVTLTNARDALQRLVAGDWFDVILCDVMMPEMTGMDLHAEVSRLAPSALKRIVFLTGGTFTARAREFLDAVPNRHLEKPFTDEMLKGLLRELLS
jgi:CheY-like chemotaxis protein